MPSAAAFSKYLTQVAIDFPVSTPISRLKNFVSEFLAGAGIGAAILGYRDADGIGASSSSGSAGGESKAACFASTMVLARSRPSP